jgi:hypothetical protein
MRCAAVIAFLCLTIGGPAPAALARAARPSDVVVARVEGTPITQAAVEAVLGPAPRNPSPAEATARAQRRGVVVERLIDRALVLRACRAAGLWPDATRVDAALAERHRWTPDPASPDAPDRTEAVRFRLCARALVANEVEAPISPEALRAAWQADVARSEAGPAAIRGRRWEIGLADFAREADAAAALRAAADAGVAEGAGLGASLTGGGTGVHAWPVRADDPAWGETLRGLSPGARSAARRNGDTLVLVQRDPATAGAGAPDTDFTGARPRLEAQIRGERRSAALQALLTRLRSGARIQRVEALR